MKMKVRPFVFIVIGVTAIALFGLFQELRRRAELTPHPVESKLIELGEISSRRTFVAPEGELFNFVIGVPKHLSQLESFEGTLSVFYNSNRVYHLAFTPGHLKQCNWLDNAKLEGYIISWQVTSNVLDAFLQPGKTYDVEITFKERPPVSSSLWLTYLQTWKVYQKSKKTN